MRTRKAPLFATLGILLLPFLISGSLESPSTNSAAFTPLVYCGHVISSNNSGLGGLGTECFPCAVVGPCACDPGEIPGSPGPTGEQQADKTGEPTNPEQGDPNPGTLALLAVLALLIWRFGR